MSADENLAVPTEMKQAASVLRGVSVLLDTVDWEALDRTCARAESLGPILLPSEFIAGSETLASNRKAIRATLDYLAALRALAPTESP